MREGIKKHPRIAGLCALVLVIAAAVLWYTRPMSFSQLTPGLDRGNIHSAEATYSNDINDFGDLDLDGDDPFIDELFELLSSHTYRRKLKNLFGWESVNEPIYWDLLFTGDCEMNMLDIDSGLYLCYSANGGSARLLYSASDYEQLRQDFFELMRSYEPDADQ